MKKILFFSFLIFLFSSCTNVQFVDPQPENIDALTVIPEKYHGIYEYQDTAIGKDSYVVTANSIDDGSLGDSLIVKQSGNYFYLNFLSDGGYEVSVIEINQCLGHENIELISFEITESNKHLFNIVETTDQFDSKVYLLDDVNTNQLNLLINSADRVSLKRVR